MLNEKNNYKKNYKKKKKETEKEKKKRHHTICIYSIFILKKNN